MIDSCHCGDYVNSLIHRKPSNIRDTACAITVADVNNHPAGAFNVAGAVKLHICRAETA